MSTESPNIMRRLISDVKQQVRDLQWKFYSALSSGLLSVLGVGHVLLLVY